MKEYIEQCWEDRRLLDEKAFAERIEAVIQLLDTGKLRVAEPMPDGEWTINEWVKKAILLYFSIKKLQPIHAEELEFYDKILPKKDFERQQVRVVPPGVARYGSYLAPGVVMMPAYVNIGAYVDSGTLIDTWATVGSCAQIGKNVHLSGGVGIGGVLEPIQANPVIIGDNCFLGSRCIVVEGVRLEDEVVLGANVVLTASTKIIDVTQKEAVEYRGFVPKRSVVIPGSIPKTFPAGTFQTPCALIIGQRSASTDKKTSLNDALRDFKI